MKKSKNMNTREYLDKIKQDLNIGTDRELAKTLGFDQSTISKWLERDNIPEKNLPKIQSVLKNYDKNEHTTTYQIPKLSLKASAGGGNHLESIDSFEIVDTLQIDKKLFKTEPKNLRAIQVDGYSMIPTLLPDSWVLFDEIEEYKGDGLYVLNYANTLMVKMIQINPNGCIDIISANKDYKSYTVCEDDQNVFKIVGKVVRVVF
jgi:phage repressor protein C with HTH and peptisase S24 domain